MDQPASCLNAENAPFIEALYEEYLQSPGSVPDRWRTYFDSLRPAAGENGVEPVHSAIRQALVRQIKLQPAPAAPAGSMESIAAQKQAAVLRLINSYRLLGHLRAATDPIQLRALPEVPDLDPAYHGLAESDLDTVFNAGTLVGPSERTLRDILQVLQDTYLGHIGSEFMHINELDVKLWVQRRLEGSRCRPTFEKLFQRHILEQLTAAEGLERYLHTKYVGQKRFSLEGGESLIPMLDTLIQHAGGQGVKEIAIGMAHRGRLNVLINIMGKAPKDIFMAFEGKIPVSELSSGDVKYHEGFSTEVQTPGGPMHLALAFNPSHLEIIDPVVLGSVRSRQERRRDAGRNQVFGVLIHGDAALAGQGVVYETFNLSQTRAFTTGGTIHIVVNNRIGFTLSHPRDIKSTMYCTDVGKVVQAPIFHVNGDDPEAVAFVVQLAVDFRMQFHRDVVIDLICFRRHGHNEADEPAATQPMMYKKIARNPGVRRLYADRLVEQGVIIPDDADDMIKVYQQDLEAGHPVSENRLTQDRYAFTADWSPYLNGKWTDAVDTGLPLPDLKRLGERITHVPAEVVLHPRVAKIVEDRKKMVAGDIPLDWGCAELLAYGSLIERGFAIRLSGQDSQRGTFFHRHAVLHNMNDGECYTPLEHLSDQQPSVTFIDSILSEEAVLGFEYGFSTTDPNTLVMWEAQFGDFANVAQVVIDQFISSSEQKWRRLSGLVLMLPHGWEGQGPEHSSARLERFMQLCAQENIQVCNPTTPAQMFHLLRRQMLRPYRKPLIIMTPKSTLRRKISFSSLADLAAGSFQNVIGEVDPLKADDVQRVVICSGKVYYDLLEERRERNIQRVAILRLEQLYPFPLDHLKRELVKYPRATEVVWAQEEPMNQGAWDSIDEPLRSCIQRTTQSLSYAGRAPMAAPAGGYYEKHLARQRRLINAALNLDWTEPHPLVMFEPEHAPLEAIGK
jgi:2-oxoglutarate dehydrogenase E1 component